VYLHGRYPSDAAAEELDRQSRVARRAKSQGFAVLALRSPQALCTAPELADWFCWPSSERNADAGAEIVQAWNKPLAAARERAGSRERFLLGFSSGGYFAGLIASRALLAVDGVVVAHGGPVEPVHALGPKPPLLLLSADDDVAQDDMLRLDTELTRDGWPHDSYARYGGHALTNEDIDAALSFFSRAHERLPLQPPLALHRPVAHARDAGEIVEPDGSSDESDDAETVNELGAEGGP
jgi:predicted esterase